MPRLLILWLSVIWSSAWCADQTYAFGYNTADARIFKGNDNQAYYYLAGSVYDMKNDQWEHYPGGLAVYKNNSLNLVIKDHLTNIRAVVSSDNSACSSTTYEAQYDYYPYGKVLRKVETPRSRFQSTDHETDSETGYNNRNARWYDDEAMRFLNVDPMAMKMPQSSPYSYCLGNPIVLVDKDGKIPYPITIRAFAPFPYFGFGFHGDNRGYSVENVSARIHQKINFDTDKSSITTKAWCSPSSHQANPDYQKTATPSVNFTKDFSISSQNGSKTFEFGTHVNGSNPLTPGAPNIDVFSNFKITENKKTGTLDVSVKLTGDNFPSTEAFITDPKGQNVFIGMDSIKALHLLVCGVKMRTIQ